MSRISRLLLSGNAGSAPPPPGISRVIGLNTSDTSYYVPNLYYVNLFNSGPPDYNTTTGPASESWYDDTWHITALPPGKELNTFIWNNMNGFNKIKSGLHHYTWDGGADATIAVISNVVTGLTKVAPGHWTFTINDFNPTETNNYLKVSRTNNTGSNIALPREAIVHDDHFALWNSRSWDCNVNPDFVTYVGNNIGRIRLAKVSGTENSLVTDNPKAIVTEDYLFYGYSQSIRGIPYTGAGTITTGMPYSFAAKLCAKLGQADLHASMPIGLSDANIQSVGAQIASVSQYTGVIDPEMGNENWGGYKGPDGASTFNWLNTTYLTQYNAAPYNANLVNGRESEAHAQMRATKLLVQGGLPANRVRLVYCSQYLGNATSGININTYGPTRFTLDYVDVGNLMGLGTTARFKDGLNVPGKGVIMMAPYNTPKDPALSDVLFNVGYSQYDWPNMTDDQIKVFWDEGDAYIAAQNSFCIAGVIAAAPNALRLCYEWGHQLNGVAGGFGQDLPVSCSVANRTVVFNQGANSGNSPTGDRWIIEYNQVDGAAGTPDGLSGGRDCWFRQRLGSNTEYYAYDSKAKAIATYATDVDAKAAAMVWTVTTNTVPFRFAPVDRIAACNVRMQAWLDGSYGAAMYNHFFATTIGADKWQQACQLCDFGYTPPLQTSGDTSAKAYGLTNGIYHTKTPRAIAYLSKTGY